MFADTPVEDPALYASQFRPFIESLTQCTGKRTVYFPVTSNAAQVEAMRSGRLHIAGFSTGPTAFAVNLAGAVPFAVKGRQDGYESYRLAVVVRTDSPFRQMSDLKGKRVAHTSAIANSGNLAPRAFFPELGLVPDQDYQVICSGGHDRSVMGVNGGDNDAAPVASDMFNRMVARGQVRGDNFRIIWQSAPFPTSSFAYAHDLRPVVAERIKPCFCDFRFPEEMKCDLGGNDRFVPATYLQDCEPVRFVADKVNAPYTRAAFDVQARREAEAEAPDNTATGPIEALRASGAPWGAVMLKGYWPQVQPAFWGIALFRWDIDVRASAVLGLGGAGGMGVVLDDALNVFQWDRAATVLLAIFAVVVLAGIVVTRIRARLI